FQGANEVYLSRIFGLFLFYVAAYNMYRLFAFKQLPDIDEQSAKRISVWKILLLVGIPSGLLGGLLGIGGGAIAVPTQQLFLKIPLRRAIANSAAMIVVISIIGATYKNYTIIQANLSLLMSIKLAAVLIPTAIIGGYWGGRLTHLLPRRILRIAFIMLMLYGGFSLVRRPAKPIATMPATVGNLINAVVVDDTPRYVHVDFLLCSSNP
ncbi:MAG: sulfite exporter TauE/SafE family protein, partial [Planctomycetota bacterium]